MTDGKTKVTLIAGGVGGAKMAEGFAALDEVELSIIGNIADDDEFHGLWVSPDIDTITYTLADLINREQGWGVHDESLRGLEVLNALGEETWMTLGDRDFGLHVYRTMRRLKGDRPSKIASDVANKFGVKAKIILPTDEVVRTQVKTANGWVSFQEYFVKHQCAPEVLSLKYEGIHKAKATPEALEAIRSADRIVIAPSNPLVSIAPILKIDGIANAVKQSSAPVVAVSPIIAGKVVKGPADRMLLSLGMRADVVGVADCYANLANALVVDNADISFFEEIEAIGLRAVGSEIFMRTKQDKERLAKDILSIAPSDTRGQAA